MRKLFLMLMAFFISIMYLPAGFAANPVPKGHGIAIHFTGAPAQDLDMMKNAGFNYARTDLYWQSVESQKGVYNWTQYDQLINGLLQRGIRPYMILDYNNRNYGAGDVMDAVDIPEQIEGFKRFAQAAAARYKGKGIVWEIWNEPNLGSIFWKPRENPYDYMNLVKAVVPAIKAADPSAVVVGPAVAYIANTHDFLRVCAEQGIFDYVDGVSLHPYINAAPESGAIQGLYDYTKGLIKQYNPDNPNLPIIAGESGYSTVWSGITEEKQAQYLVRELMFNQYHGVPVSIFYDWVDDGPDPNNVEHRFGIVRQDRSPKPSYYALQNYYKAIGNKRFVKRLPSASSDFLMEFSDGANTTVAAWTTGSTHNVTINGKSVSISNMPVYVPVQVSTPTPTPTVPAAPNNLKVDSVTKGATSGNYFVNLSWQDNSNNETGFEIYQSINSTNNFQLIKNPAENVTSYGIDIGSNPTAGTYYYKIVAVNNTGKSAESNVASTQIADTTTPPPTPAPLVPVAPSDLKVNSVTKGAKSNRYFVNLSWQDNSNNETGFEIYQSINSTNNYRLIKTPVENGTDYGIDIGKNPVPGVYYYKIVAVNANGKSAESNVAQAHVLVDYAPSAPSNLKVDSVTKGATTGNYFVNVSWDDNSNNETGFEIYQSINSTNNFQLIKNPAENVTSYGIDIGSNPTAGTYYYKIVAVNNTGKSAESNVASTPVTLTVAPPSAPTGLTSIAAKSTTGSNLVILNWQDNSDNEQGFNLYVSNSATGSYNKVGTLQSGQSLVVHILDSLLNSATSLYYQVKAFNSGGESSTSNTSSVNIAN